MTRRLVGDERARVPLAVVGALLLVTSATLAAGISAKPAATGYDARPAVESAWTVAHASAARAAVAASVRAARNPVVRAADTPYGRVLSARDPFRDALRLRIYVAVRSALAESAVTVGGVRATPTLPPVRSPADARHAIGRVTLTEARNGSATRVRVRDVTVVAARHGGTVERDRRTLTVTAPTPVIAVHDRVRTFARRLGRGVTEGSGLARRVTVSLTAIAEARGLAQYGGAPIKNVVANRHVALATNHGVLALERATFGRADPSGVDSLRRAAVHAGARDLLAGAQNAGVNALDAGLNGTAGTPNATHGVVPSADLGPADPQPVPLGPIADDALVGFLDGDGPRSLAGVLARLPATDRGANRSTAHSRREAASRAVSRAHAALRGVTGHVDRRSFLAGTPLASLDARVNATVRTGGVAGTTGNARAAALARRAYVARVRSLLADRRSKLAKAQHAVHGALADRGVPVAPGPIRGPSAPAVPMRVSASPAYLSLSRVSPAESDASEPHYPLGARNTNLFTVPSGDAADAVVGALGLGGSRRVDFATAASTLRAAERTGADRGDLRAAVASSLAAARTRLKASLGSHTALSDAERRAALDAGFSRWRTTGARALALANGSLPDAVGAAAARLGVDRPTIAAARLRATARALRKSGRLAVRESATGPVRSRVKQVVHGAVSDAVQRGASAAIARSAHRLLPAGMALLPVPGLWYVTVNAWDVAAHGGYGRFAVSAPLGRPGVGDGTLRYVRTDRAVGFDVTGDGATERLGRDVGLSFRYRTGVVVVVPPGPPGVGDGGNADERSAGW